MGFSAALARLRAQHKLTQAELGKKINVTPQAISKWENGISEPDLGMVGKIARLFCVSVGELLGESTEAEHRNKEEENSEREVYFSGHMPSVYHAELDHGVCHGYASIKGNTDAFAKNALAEEENLKKRGYTEYFPMQSDLLLYYFWDEERSAFGFYYDGNEQFVCPIERLRFVAVKEGRELTVTVEGDSGEPLSYQLSFSSRRAYPILLGMIKTKEEEKELLVHIKKETAERIERVRASLLSKADLAKRIRAGEKEAPSFNCEEYAARHTAALSARAALEESLLSEGKKKNVLALVLAGTLFALSTTALILLLVL